MLQKLDEMYLVGQYHSHCIDHGTVWSFQGIFTSVELAVAACRNANYFYVPVKLNVECPDEIVEFQDCVYPHSQTKE